MQSQLTWDSIIKAEETQPYFQDIVAFIKQERAAGKTIYPSDEEIFNAFKYTPFSNVKVVILGQDPYHGENQAHGLSFSVRPDVKIPPSLRNIYKELANDIPNFDIPKHGHLVNWAKQGVLLLNTVLTVEAKQAHSHAKIGWETFTDKIIETINQHQKNVVFLLWGSHAQKKGAFIDTERHAVLKSVHPSPLSAHRGFLGCRHFSLTNEYLKSKGKHPIDWNDLKI